MFDRARHWLTPHHTNNYRAKLLHNAGMTVLISAFLAFTAFTQLLESPSLNILGFTSTITTEEVIKQTNERRIAEGLPPLKISRKLEEAARWKAQDMLEDNYWAHEAPDGTSPWDFILGVGYNYNFAGENLAKDFSNTNSMLQAWMDSPTHRENILSDRYTEIGIAVVPGRLEGEETMLVVQMFGSLGESAGVISGQSDAAEATQAEEEQETAENIPTIAQVEASEETPGVSAMFNEFNVQKAVGLGSTILLMLALIFDLLVAESKNLQRKVGKNWAHLLFANVILIALTVISAGHIL